MWTTLICENWRKIMTFWNIEIFHTSSVCRLSNIRSGYRTPYLSTILSRFSFFFFPSFVWCMIDIVSAVAASRKTSTKSVNCNNKQGLHMEIGRVLQFWHWCWNIYRVSHNTVSTLFLLFSRVLEHIQRNFS